MTTNQVVTLKKTEPHPWAMTVGDKRRGSRYLVFVNSILIGEVEKRSESSYRSDGTGSRTRWGFRGYARYWRATKLHEFTSVTDLARTRQQAVNQLVEASQ